MWEHSADTTACTSSGGQEQFSSMYVGAPEALRHTEALQRRVAKSASARFCSNATEPCERLETNGQSPCIPNCCNGAKAIASAATRPPTTMFICMVFHAAGWRCRTRKKQASPKLWSSAVSASATQRTDVAGAASLALGASAP
eukprot:15480212-Alexandrium_andersonii.AAC.1